MKKILIFLSMIVAVSANAQNRFSKGDWVVGAQSNGMDLIFGRNLPTDAALNLNAVGSYFFTDKFAVDVLAGYSYERSVSYVMLEDVSREDYQSTHYFNFGAGVRYYPASNLFARVGYYGSVPLFSGDERSYFDARVGYDIFLSKKVFFEPALYYQKNLNKSFSTNRGTENVFGLSLGFGVRF